MTDEQAYTNKENAKEALQSAFQNFIDAAIAYGMDDYEIAEEFANNFVVGDYFFEVN